ncbi:DMT family transporter [Bacillus sp. ISL-46]|uniref:DMT family transporter n=1 Tax=Bacillus sp. ISL-46 TaxID=2819129 RepID=UPI001BE76DF2|nr:DMT family transporter [Bacillus sp. ISL-46]MBT2724938.1 DMT family transporter [Bacillus sp. ISL-46]
MTQKQANLILATVSMGWGTSYIFMKLCVDTISPLTIVALRFGIAFIVMMAIFYKKIIHVDAKTLKYSAIVGALLCGIFIALLYGMKNTTASSAGFLTSTTVILVPILQIFITRKLPSKKIILGVPIVSIGLVLLTIGDDFTLAFSSLYCLVAAFLYTVHIIVTNQFAREVGALQLGIYQLGFVSLYATIGIFIFETPVLPHEAMNWFAILGLALICSAYGFVMQPIAQKYTTPESTGFLFSLEPIFSAIFAFIFLHENMGRQGYFGALLILAGVFIANSPSKNQHKIRLTKENKNPREV